MAAADLTPLAFGLTILGLLLGLSSLFSRLAGRAGVPVVFLFLLFGMLAGSGGIGGIAFDDYGFAFRAGTVALVLILFDGGLNTSFASVRAGYRPAAVLATLGVVATAGFVALAAWLLGVPWQLALVVGAIVSSTDAAAVFSILRGSGLNLKRRLGSTLELESGLNDPMAVLLTLAMTEALVTGDYRWENIFVSAIFQLAIGLAAGWAIGFVGRELLQRARVAAGGLYPVLTLAVAFVAFGVPTLLKGSGFLSVYVAGMMMGNGIMRYRTGVLRVHDAVAWFAQVAMFLLLGLLVDPSRLVEAAPMGLALGALVAFVLRPLAVFLCLVPFKFAMRERAYIAWVGLRGAVPIVLATFPVLAGAPGAGKVFHLVFFVVVVNQLIPGATVAWVTRKLGLLSKAPKPPDAVLEITSTHLLSGEAVGFHVDQASAVCGARIAELPFPESASAAVILRGADLIAPRGSTVLQEGDHVYIFCRSDDVPFIKLMFGEQETE